MMRPRLQTDAVLSALLAAKGEPVPLERLMDVMAGAGKASLAGLHNAFSRLRNDGHEIAGCSRDGFRMCAEAEPEPPRHAMRKCLGGCEQRFMSEGPGNRICGRCSGQRPTHLSVAHGLVGVRSWR